MPSNSLILIPRDWQASLQGVAPVVACLLDLGIIGEQFPHASEPRYRAGPRFLDHLTFLGCSPVIAMDGPGANGEFCQVSVTAYAETRFLGGTNVKAPRCPRCGQREEGWAQAIQAWERAKADYRWRCPSCHSSVALPEMRWRQCAGFGRLLIRIEGVFEGEAVPGERFLETLQGFSNYPWDYFYFQG